ATARMLTGAGGKVLIADLKEKEGSALAAELGSAAKFVRTDVTDEASMKAAVDAAGSAFRGGHRLVNRAGLVYGAETPRHGRPARARALRARHQYQSGRQLQRRAPRRRGDGEEHAERGRRARRDREHGVRRRVRRADGTGRVCGVESGRRRNDAAARARP